ncbi:MAG: DUF2202 domain-containing protein [Anaerolineae bacterium]
MNVKKVVLTTVLTGALLGIAVPSVFAQGPAATDTALNGMGFRRGASTAVDSTTAYAWQRGGMGVGTAVLADLDQAEIDGLLYMREEEKLAHDVYVAMYEKWDVAEFNTIANAEQRHSESVLRQLDRYGIEDPTSGLAAGEFKNTELQALYNDLIAQGSQSLEAALRVGTAIEEIDILDLEEEIAGTENAALLRVYDNLLRGSRNHLRSFVGLLEDEGVTYSPEYMDADAYEGIVSTANEQGSGRGAGSSNGASGECDESGTPAADASMMRQGGRW